MEIKSKQKQINSSMLKFNKAKFQLTKPHFIVIWYSIIVLHIILLRIMPGDIL